MDFFNAKFLFIICIFVDFFNVKKIFDAYNVFRRTDNNSCRRQFIQYDENRLYLFNSGVVTVRSLFETNSSLLKSTNIPPAAVRPMPVAARTEPGGGRAGRNFFTHLCSFYADVRCTHLRSVYSW